MIAAQGPAAPAPQDLSPERVLALVSSLASAEASQARVDLDALIATSSRARDAGELDAAGRQALLWAELVQRDWRGAAPPELTDLAGEVAADGDRYGLILGLCQLAETALLAGRLDVAGRTTRFGIGYPGAEGAWTIFPRLWYLRSEAARLAGLWGDVEESLDGLLRSLPPDQTFIGDYEPYLPAHLDFRARQHLGRARLKVETGLLEQARAEIEAGTLAANRCAYPQTRALAYSIEIELAMASQSFEYVLQLVAGAAKQPWYGELPPEHRVLFTAIEGICQGEQERIELLEADAIAVPTTLEESEARRLLTAAIDSGLLGIPDRVWLLVLLADGALLRGNPNAALEHLDAIDGLFAPAESSAIVPRDASLSAALRWRALSRLSAAGGEGAPTEEDQRAAYDALVDAFDDLLAQWRTLAPRPGGSGFLHIEWRTYVLETLIDATLELHPDAEGVERAFEHVLATQAMGSIARGRGLAVPSLEEVRDALLGRGRIILVLVPGRTGSHLFVLRDGSIECHALASNEALLALTERVVTQLRPDGRPVNMAALRELRDALLPPPVQKLLPACKGLYALGFDRLLGLSIACLPLADGRILASAVAVSELPSLPFAVERARRSSAVSGEQLDALFVLVPDPQGVAELDALSFGEDERSSLLAAFDPARVAVLEDERATPEALLAPGTLEGAGILFVLAHTLPDKVNEGSARLVLSSEDGKTPATLGVEEIRDLSFEGLVVLASCSAASAPPRLGDDALAHLGGAFLEAGARAVVLTGDRVEYRKTLALFEHALERLAAGEAAAEALRAAYAATLGPEPWKGFRAAGFKVIGLGLEPARAPAPR